MEDRDDGTHGVTDEDEGALFVGGGQERVQVPGRGDAVLRLADVVTPCLAGPVVGADPNVTVEPVADVGPG